MKRKLFAIIFCVLLTIQSFGTILVEAYSMKDLESSKYLYLESAYGYATKLFDVPYGDCDEELRRTEIMEDSEVLTPKSFTVDERGNFYILDTLNEKIKVYSKNGVFVKAIDLPSNMYGLDIEKVDENIYIYADDYNLYKINELNPDSAEQITSISRENIAGIYSVGDELFVRSYNGSDIKITASNNDAIRRNNDSKYVIDEEDTVIGLSNSADVALLTSNQDVSYNLSCRLEPAGAYCLKNEDNTLYALSNETSGDYTETRISKIQDGLVLETALTISGKAYEYGFPFKKIYVKDDMVYQMVPQKDVVSFYVLPWATIKETRITDAMVELYASKADVRNFDSNSVVSRASFSVTRDEALGRAYNMCYEGWSYDPTTMHTPTTTTTSSPDHLGDTEKGVAGIPYCWGGMNGLDTATYTGSSAGYLQNFSDCLTSGKTAGNITAVSNSWVEGTFGIDCSGLICAAFKIPNKLGTIGLGNRFDLTTWDAVQIGDVAIDPGSHTFMIKYIYSSNSSGIYMVNTYESTVDGYGDCAKGYHRDYADICNAYDIYTY